MSEKEEREEDKKEEPAYEPLSDKEQWVYIRLLGIWFLVAVFLLGLSSLVTHYTGGAKGVSSDFMLWGVIAGVALGIGVAWISKRWSRSIVAKWESRGKNWNPETRKWTKGGDE